MSTSEILDTIDRALEDNSAGPDAMRWRPELATEEDRRLTFSVNVPATINDGQTHYTYYDGSQSGSMFSEEVIRWLRITYI